MARYSKAFKAKAVARLLPPESATPEDVSVEMGVRTARRSAGSAVPHNPPRKPSAMDSGPALASIPAPMIISRY